MMTCSRVERVNLSTSETSLTPGNSKKTTPEKTENNNTRPCPLRMKSTQERDEQRQKFVVVESSEDEDSDDENEWVKRIKRNREMMKVRFVCSEYLLRLA